MSDTPTAARRAAPPPQATDFPELPASGLSPNARIDRGWGGESPSMTALQTLATPAFHPGPMADRPDPEVPERARRRTFTTRYKLAVLAEYDAAEPGAKGAILRREGLYSSHLVDWRRQRDAGALAGLSQARGSRPADAHIDQLAETIAALDDEVDREMDPLTRNSPTTRRFAVVSLESGETIGLTGLWDLDWHNRSAMSGIKLDVTSAPRGAGSDTVMLVNALASYEVGLHRLSSSILDFNAASYHLYVRKCGWRLEGIEKQAGPARWRMVGPVPRCHLEGGLRYPSAGRRVPTPGGPSGYHPIRAAGHPSRLVDARRAQGPSQPFGDALDLTVAEPNPAGQAQSLVKEAVGDPGQMNLGVAKDRLLVHGLPDRPGLDVLRLQRLTDPRGRTTAQVAVEGHRGQPRVADPPRRVGGHDHALQACEHLGVHRADLPAPGDHLRQPRQLRPAEPSQDVAHPVVEADLLVLVPGERLAGLGGPEPRLVHELLVIGDQHPATRCGHDLVAVEGVDARVAHRAGGAVAVRGTEGLGRVDEDGDVVLGGDGQDLVVVGRSAEEVDG